jgi:hypothetical protein
LKSFAFVGVLALLMFGAGAVPSSAAPVYYTLIGETNAVFSEDPWNLGPVHEESFQFIAPDFITSYLDFTKADAEFCVSCSPFGTAVQFFPDAAFGFGRDQINFTDAIGVIFGFFFEPGSFGTVGVYSAKNIPEDAIGNVGRLIVSLEKPELPVPEPSVVVMMVAGVAAACRGRLRRRV